MFLKREEKKEKKIRKKLVLIFLVFCFISSLILFPISRVKAAEVMVGDKSVQDILKEIFKRDSNEEKKKEKQKKEDEEKKDSLLEMLGKTVNNAFKKVAYDAATYIGSGGKGQKPLWISESWGTYLTNIGDEAVGEFIEKVGKENGILEFNLCKPDFAVKFKIGLGLVEQNRPGAPECTFSKMKENWEKELHDPNFLPKFQDMFDPKSNDLGIALSLQTGMFEEVALKNEEGKNLRLGGQGWLSVKDIGERSKGVPLIGKTISENSLIKLFDSIGDYKGFSFKEILNVFINQLAVTYITKALKEMDVKDITSPTLISDTLFNKEAAPSNQGVSGIKERLRKVLRPDFTVRGDYDILAELTTCPDPTTAGPTNCVINSNFSRAISEKVTVGEAIEQGYLNPNGIFGFTLDGVEPAFNEGYPYRSMIILRKFRILPVGWEIAGQFIKELPQNINGIKNLGDLVACFDKNDDFSGYYATWCDGLVDPSWVLKAPLNYCKREGPGPEIIMKQIIGEGDDSELIIARNDSYCADEQSCIKENDDGSCEFYGYCTEEKRKWQFNSESCEPKYNTCQTFRSREGKTVSYLENTLDYRDCSIDTAGCKWYCQDYSLSAGQPLSGPVAYWNFDEGNGPTAYDSVGSNNGTLYGGVTWNSSGRVGGAIDFNGSTGYIRNTSFTIGNYEQRTFSAWIKPNSDSVSESIISLTDGTNNYKWSEFYYDVGNGLYFMFGDDSSYNERGNTSNLIPLNKWSHVAVTVDITQLSADRVKIYYNGESQTFTYLNNNGNLIYDALDLNLNVGVHDDGSLSAFFDGSIDEVMIFDRALSALEIEEYYNSVVGDNWTCTESEGSRIYLDKNAEECDDSEEGCHEFIRTKAGIGANLLPNSSFETIDTAGGDLPDDGIDDNFDWWGYIGQATSTDSFTGLYSLQLLAPLNISIIVGPSDYMIGGQAYTLSFYAKNCGTGGTLNIETTQATLDTTTEWQYFSATHIYPQRATGNQATIDIAFAGATCLIDSIKLEHGSGTAYDDYRGSGLIYEKFAPAYLGCDGIDDPVECDNFARACTQYEEGCEMYTSVNSNISVPAKATAINYCPAECVGYDTYVQKDSNFDSSRAAYFIPSTGKQCSALSAGCDEFTNLDTVAQGGEGREYYTTLRQCTKPSAVCSDFYTWEGSDEAGYQLRVFNLEENTANGEPLVTSNDISLCNPTIYNLPSSDPTYNSDCREFYNTGGNISHHLMTRTISCSDECFPLRRTELNIDTNLTDPSLPSGTCDALGDGTPQYAGTIANQFNWDATNNECIFCKNGGYWDAQQNACIYDAIPGEGQTCSASVSGCREYVGNIGNNMRVIVNNDFEGSTQGWGGESGTTVSVSNTAIIAGGNSLYVSGGTWTASTTIGNVINQNSSYVLSFIAKAYSGPVDLTAEIYTDLALNTALNGSASLVVSDWGIYKMNIDKLALPVTGNESLVIKWDGTGAGNKDFYIDDIKLTEITDRYYIVKNSWNTPASCYEDISGNLVGVFYNLGCDEYSDRENNTHYLHNFNRLCLDSAVGCELMIDTHNYSSAMNTQYKGQYVDLTCNPATDPDCIVILADNYVYAVYDKDKECNQEDKGCEFLGEANIYEGDVLFTDMYLKNNPDKYSSILCGSKEEGCEEWTTSEGISYFKDPGDQICEWRLSRNVATSTWKWYKKKINKCDIDGSGDIDMIVETNICFNDLDCTGGASCIKDENDYACRADPLKTFGSGGYNNQVFQPGYDIDFNVFWAGVCPAGKSGCSEYIDPISKFSTNIILNNDFSQDIDSDLVTDNWSTGQQNITLDPNTLYVLAVEGANTITVESFDATPSLTFDLVTYSPVTNDLIDVVDKVSLTSAAGERKSILFYTYSAIQNVTVTAQNASLGNNSKVEIKKTAIAYQLKQEVDKESCNGIVNFEDGCVLFNERSQNGVNKIGLDWDADLTYYDGTGMSMAVGAFNTDNNANALLKVRPDRVCGEWLACRAITSTAKEKICLGIGICDKFNDEGECDRFIDNPILSATPIMQKYPSIVQDIGNKSGYVKISHDIAANKNYGTDTNPYYNDDYKFGEMESFGVSANILNSGFEDAIDIDADDEMDIPDWGWDCDLDGSGKYICEIIDNPVENQDESICYKKEDKNCYIYAPEGRNFLKVDSRDSNVYKVETSPGHEINVGKDLEYMFTAYVNNFKVTDGKTRIKIEGYTDQGVAIPQPGVVTRLLRYDKQLAVYDIPSALDWQLIAFTFTTGPITSAIRIEFDFTVQGNGTYYIDDIKMKTTLKSRDNWRTAQSCRLYPEDDSLSCEYYDDSEIYLKGWRGYCLEYDRSPGGSDACILWWPTPNNADVVNDYCGNGVQDGEEDCDCGTDINGNVIYDCFNGPLPFGAITTPPATPTPAPYGSYENNQYHCVSCTWVGGYCGDGAIQTTDNSEHCDWNDADILNPNLKQQTCWSEHAFLGDLQNQFNPPLNPPHYAQEDFIHDYVPGDNDLTGVYLDYLWGDLACFDNSYPADRCRFKDLGCSDDLFDDGVNTVHTRKDCIDDILPSVVVNKDGITMTDANGFLINRPLAGNNNKDFFCKFVASSCPVGWQPYIDSGPGGTGCQWTVTSPNGCNGDNISWCDAPGAGGCDSGTDRCTTGSHSTIKTTCPETCGYCSESVNWWGTCEANGRICTANIVEVGCY